MMQQQRSWFWRKIGFWFVPVASPALSRNELSKIQRVRLISRTTRRGLVILWAGLMVYDTICFMHSTSPMVSSCAFQTAPITLLLSLLLLMMRFSRPTLQDRALMEYGKEFSALQPEQRTKLVRKAALGLSVGARQEEFDVAQRRGKFLRLLVFLEVALIYIQLFFLWRYDIHSLRHAKTMAGYVWRYNWVPAILVGAILALLAFRHDYRNRTQDERDSTADLVAQGMAYRLQRYVLSIALIGLIFFCWRYPPTRHLLAGIAVGFTSLMITFLMMASLISVWMEQDRAGEPELLIDEPQST